MGNGTERRRTADGMTDAQLPLWPDQAVGGGSAGDPRGGSRGGGYQNTRTALPFLKSRARSARGESGEDPRIADLRRARVGLVWIRVAERVGFEAFMQVWQTLCDSIEVADDRNRVYVPCIEKFLAAQRNLLMRELIAQGLSRTQIRAELTRRLGVAPALRTIEQAIARVRRA